MKTETTGKAKSKKTFFWMLFFLLLFTAANIVLYLTRNEIDMFVPSTYKTLYHPTDVPTLSGTRVVRRAHLMLKIAMREQPVRWVITDDTGERYEQNGKFPVLKLKEFVHGYELEPQGLKNPAPDLDPVRVLHAPNSTREGAGPSPTTTGWFRRAFPWENSISTPSPTGPTPSPTSARRKRRRGVGFCARRWGSPATEATLEKIDKICAYQAVLYKTQAGTPDDRMSVEDLSAQDL